ncbi:MAG: hypothetical protein JWM14_1411 [Chitinophagaceae bacterium]|nr:hypothetical protein [Chitinophagaceae bacterium]
MKQFIVKILFFGIPILLLLLLPILILYQTQENFRGIEDVLSSKRKYLIGYAYDETKYKYIKRFELNNNPKFHLLALGSSRVLQFRKEMFDSSFYNAGYTISRISDFIPFLDRMPHDKHPDYLVIGLDQWMFNSKWDSSASSMIYQDTSQSFDKIPTFKVILNVYSDLYSEKILLNALAQKSRYNKVGLNAVMNNSGFRKDGSMCYGDKLLTNDTTVEDYLYKDTYRRIRDGNRRFEYGENLSVTSIRELERLLAYCKLHNIYVVAFLPPFADQVYDKMKSSGNYEYIDKLPIALTPLFARYNFEWYDFSTVKKCNSDDEETLDGFHGGELTYQKMVIQMLENGSKLNKCTDVKRLKREVKIPINRYTVYDY